MLAPAFLRDLRTDPAAPLRHAHLAAASGLALCGSWMYFVADDEHHIGCLRRDAGVDEPVRLLRVRDGELPADPAGRKRRKPDFESLLSLGPRRLLALGSGSRPNRMRGVLIVLDELGAAASMRELDLAPLFEPLQREFGDLNIEGAFAMADEVRLLQRANAGQARNASVAYPRNTFLGWLEGLSAPPSFQVIPHAIGAAAGIPFGFTDGTAWGGSHWLFSAVAEDTRDSYADGACVASAIGCIDGDGALVWLHELEGAPKVEGIALASPTRVLLVTDADEPAAAARLLTVDLPPST